MHDHTQKQHSKQQMQAFVVLHSGHHAHCENDDDVCEQVCAQDDRRTTNTGLKSFLWTIGLL